MILTNKEAIGMRTIERVKMIKTLKAGELVWEAGTILPKEGESLHPIIVEEVRLNTGTVEVLSYRDGSPAEDSGLKVPLNENVSLKAEVREKEVNARAAAEKMIRDSEAKERKALFKEIEELKLQSSKFEKSIAELRKDFLILKDSFEKNKSVKEDERSSDTPEKKEEGTPEKMSTEVSPAKTKTVRRVVSRR